MAPSTVSAHHHSQLSANHCSRRKMAPEKTCIVELHHLNRLHHTQLGRGVAGRHSSCLAATAPERRACPWTPLAARACARAAAKRRGRPLSWRQSFATAVML
eukprot:117763-Chlamydomonas_euryale.AAC.1